MGVRPLLRAAVLTVVVAALAGWEPAGAAPKTPPGNPPGNNGTVKVARDAEPEPDDEPHVDGCRLWVEFFGFDQDEQAHVTFETQAPTGDGDLLLSWDGVISDDPAGGGQDEDRVIGFNLSEALQPYEPDPQQGYHVKLESDSLGAPGGAKQKVFWLNCNPSPPGTFRVTKLVNGTDPSPGPFTLQVSCNHTPADTEVQLSAGESGDIPAPMGTTCEVAETDPQGAAVSFLGTADGLPDDQAQVTGAQPAVVTVVNTYPGSAAAGPVETVVAGVTEVAAEETAPVALDTLPRTGADSETLAQAGAWILAVGGLALMAAIRRR